MFTVWNYKCYHIIITRDYIIVHWVYLKFDKIMCISTVFIHVNKVNVLRYLCLLLVIRFLVMSVLSSVLSHVFCGCRVSLLRRVRPWGLA